MDQTDDDGEPSYDREAIVLEVARLIWRKGITIGDLYTVLGVDLASYRCDPDDVISELSGIFKGQHNKPDEE